MTAQWKYVIPIEKADFSDDKPWVISGVVAGPDFVDAEGDQFLPEAIKKMADFINENPLPLLDWHGLNHKNTIIDPELGEVTRAWVNEMGQLEVEAELDKDAYGAQWLAKKMKNPARPRKFGLSVKGLAVNPRPVMQSGKITRQIADVIPEEISLTTRPFYQPSLGTVIMKAIDEAAEAESVEKGDKSEMSKDAPKAGDTPMSPEENSESLLPAVDANPETEGVEPVTELPEPDVMQNVAVAQPEEESVEKSERDDGAAAIAAGLESVIRNIVRQEIGNSKVEPVAPSAAAEPAESPVEKSQVDQPESEIAVLAKAVADLSAQFERVMEVVPEVKAPGVLVQKSDVDEMRERFAQMSPSERIRAGFEMSERTEPKLR